MRAGAKRVMRRSAAAVTRPLKWIWDPRRRKKILVSAAVATALAAGVKYGPSVMERLRGKAPIPKPPIVKPVPLLHAELSRYKVSQLDAENLVEVIGGKRHNLIGEGVVEAEQRRKFKLSIARQWIEALDGKPDFANDRLRGFAGLNAKTVVSLSETAMEFRGVRGGDLSPREVAGFLEGAQRLVRDCQLMHGNSIARGKQFYKDPAFVRRLPRDSLNRRIVDFFARLAEIDPAAVRDVYSELGL